MLFDSNVFNMIDWTVNGVEPCTGMYIRTIPIASLPSCQLQGPTLDLALRFNQFNANDYGFGVGWELTLTRVDVENGASTLILANGQRYRILSVSGNTVNLQYKNTLTFNCTTTGTGQYTIIYKNGFIEELVNYQIRTLTAPNNKKSTSTGTQTSHSAFRMKTRTGQARDIWYPAPGRERSMS